jgi:hypothetical protein
MGMGGGVLLVLGVILIFVYVRSKRRAGYLIAARASKVGELEQTASTVASEIDGGGFRHFAELSGQAVCPNPLISPLAEEPCLYYSMAITRRYEEEYYTRDKNGNQVRRTRTGTDVMSSESRQVDFELDDGSGQLAINVQGADFDGLMETVDRFEPGDVRGGVIRTRHGTIRVGAVGRNRRTLGYQYDERILPLDRRLTVVGEVSDARGALDCGTGGPVFIVSTRTKKEMIGSAEKIAKITSVISGICVVGGIGLLVAHFVG